MTRPFLLLAFLLMSVGVALGQNTTAYTNTSTTSVPYNESDNTGNNGPDDWWAPVVVTIQAGSGFTGTRSAPVFVNGHQLGTISSGVSLTATLSRNITADPSNGYYSSYALQNNGNTVYSGVISVIAAGYEGDCNYTYSCASSASQNGHDFNYFPDPVNVTVTLNYPAPPLTADFPYIWHVNTWKNYELVGTDTSTGQSLNSGIISGSTSATGTLSIVNVSNGDGYKTTVIDPISGNVLQTFDMGTMVFTGTNNHWTAPTMVLSATDPMTIVAEYKLTSTGTGGGSATFVYNGVAVGTAHVGTGTTGAPAVVSGSFTTTGLNGDTYGWVKSPVGGSGAGTVTQSGVVGGQNGEQFGIFAVPLEQDNFGGGESSGNWQTIDNQTGEQVWSGSGVPPDYGNDPAYSYWTVFTDGTPQYHRKPVSPSPTPTPTPSPSPSPTPVPTPTPNPSATPIPTPTPGPSGTPQPTPTAPPNASPTPPLTTGSDGLTGQDIYTAVKQALEDSGNDNSGMPAENFQPIGGDPSTSYADHSGIYAMQNGINSMGAAGANMKAATGTVMQTLGNDVQSIPTSTGKATSWDLGTYTYPGGQYHLVINFSSLPPAWFWGREIELCLLYLGYLIACIRLIGSNLT